MDRRAYIIDCGTVPNVVAVDAGMGTGQARSRASSVSYPVHRLRYAGGQEAYGIAPCLGRVRRNYVVA